MKYLCMLMGLLAFSVSSSASTCIMHCQVVYDQVVDRIHNNSSGTDIKDFRINCVDFHKGFISSRHVRNFILCKKRIRHSTEVAGFGDNITEARVSARDNCDALAPSETDDVTGVSIRYRNFRCNP